MTDDRVAVISDRQIFMAQRSGGISRYFVELSREFSRSPELGVDFRIPLHRSINEHLSGLDSNRHALLGWGPGTGPTRALFNRAFRFSGLLAPSGWRDADLIHHTYYAPEIIDKTPDALRVVTVHDMIHEMFPDLPEAAERSQRKRRAVEAADAIICVSETTRRDMQRIWGSWLHKPTEVIHHGVGQEFSPNGPTFRPGYEYLLYVGSRGGYKSFHDVVQALSALTPTHPTLHLVLVGGRTLTEEESRTLATLGLGSRVHQEDVGGAELPSFYRGARAMVFPSRYEGFGMPALEAMASGCPAVLSATPALIEIGGDAAHYFRPGDVDSLVEVLRSLLDSAESRQALVRQGLSHSLRFSWRRTAEATAGVYRRVVTGPQRNS